MNREAWAFAALAGELVILELILVHLGGKFGPELGLGTYGEVLGAVIGLVAWIIQMIFAVQKYEKQNK